LHSKLREREQNKRLRSLQTFDFTSSPVAVRIDGEKYINFSSNDYLGLSKHPKLKKAAADTVRDSGTSSTASRLITGSYSLLETLENELAQFTGRESALVFNSGYQANATLLKALAGRNACILMDKLAHNSLLNGGLASRAKLLRFHHNDMNHLEELLKRHCDDYESIWIVVESVYSMDGDTAPLENLTGLAEQYGARTYVDEAHSLGVYGPDGSGRSRNYTNIDIMLGTFGKAFGSFGAFVACSSEMRDYLINFCEGFIYTTALPPATTAATLEALRLMPQLADRREKLMKNVAFLNNLLNKAGADTGSSHSQIIPVITGSEETTLQISKKARREGFIATAIRPPTVPTNACRIRVTLSSEHTKTQIQNFAHLITDNYEQ